MTSPARGSAIDGAGARSGDAASPRGETLANGDFDRLRELLLGDEFDALSAARQRIDALERAQAALPNRLPAALEAVDAAGDSARVARALARPVAQALGAAVRDNRQTLVDALFPVIGPLIRKAIAEALRALVADFNGAMESGFSPRALGWRWQAWRTGVPYAHVALRHRLTWRIDHVFLIDRASGLVLHHASAPGLPPLDADAIAGMLTAIGDFVGDSMGAHGDALESAQVGEHVVRVVPGPRANLACFVRGVPPAALGGVLEHALEHIHAQFAAEHATPNADTATSVFAALQPSVLMDAVNAAGGHTPAARAPARWPLLLVLLAVLTALAWYAARRERWDARVDALRASLSAQPGFVLTAIESRPWRTLVIHGLADPDAPPPAALVAGADLGGVQPHFDTRGFVSTEDAMIARRAQRLLQPPAGVDVGAANGVLDVRGAAPQAWIDGARARAGWIAGVSRVDFAVAAVIDDRIAARSELDALARSVPSLRIGFSEDASPVAGVGDIVDDIARQLRRARSLAAIAGVGVEFASIGANDEVGTDEANRRVRAERSRWLADALAARGVFGADGGTLPTAEDARSNIRSAYVAISLRETPP